jgi:light-regulated signal transduction histidine kinase (bacteriophytochrome)
MKTRYLPLILCPEAWIVIGMNRFQDHVNIPLPTGSFHSVEELQQVILATKTAGEHILLVNLPAGDRSSFLNFAAVAAILMVGLLLLSVAIIARYHYKTKKLNRILDETRHELAACKTDKEQWQAMLHSSEEHQQQLLQAVKKANDEINAFSYSISHDLRAPLRAINGYSAILLEEHHTHLDESGKRALSIIQQNSSRMDELISDLLELAKLGTLAVSKQKFNMHQLVEHVLHEHDKTLKTNTTLNVLPMDEAFADSYLLKKVWDNLISNAIKFSSKAETPVIEIGSARQDGEQIFWIRDNGVGFDPVYTDKLFKVFSRLHGKKEFEGTGAGLAISKKIIEAHGGRIWAEAQLAKGATFYFSLPRN